MDLQKKSSLFFSTVKIFSSWLYVYIYIYIYINIVSLSECWKFTACPDIYLIFARKSLPCCFSKDGKKKNLSNFEINHFKI
jgi:hypothetical protein